MLIDRYFNIEDNNSDNIAVSFEPSGYEGVKRLKEFVDTDVLMYKHYTSSSLLPDISSFHKHIKLKNIIEDFLLSYKTIFLIDYPGLFLNIIKKLKKRKKKVFYVYPPQVWLWGENRIEYLRMCDGVFTLYPSEANFLRNNGIKASFMGFKRRNFKYSDNGKVLFLCGVRHPLTRKRRRKIEKYGIYDNIIISSPGYREDNLINDIDYPIKGVFTFPSFSSLLFYESRVPVCNYIDNRLLRFLRRRKGLKFFSAVNREFNDMVQQEILRFPTIEDINNDNLFNFSYKGSIFDKFNKKDIWSLID